jgi:hypothetical protein
MSEPQETGIGQKQERIEKPQVSSSKPRKVYVLGVAFVAVLLLGASFGIMISATTPSIPTVIEPGSMVNGYSYIIFKNGATTYAKNGSTGAIVSFSTSSSTVLQYCIDAIGTNGGGNIYAKFANYTLDAKLLISKPHIDIEGEIGTTFTSSLLPCFEVNNSAPLFDLGEASTMRDIRLTNLRFYYTGIEQTGVFVKFSMIQTDKNYQGGVILTNIQVRSAVITPEHQETIPTNQNFVGISFENTIGIETYHLSVVGWGTGFEYKQFGGDNQGSHNLHQNFNAGYCFRGVNYVGGSVTCEVWISPKIMHCTDKGWFGAPFEVEFISPQFESLQLADAALYFGGYKISVSNGMFSQLGAVGVFLKWDDEYPIPSSRVVISQCHFDDVSTAIYTERPTYLYGNSYTDVDYNVTLSGSGKVYSIQDGYVSWNTGFASITGNYGDYYVLHGLSGIPTTVIVTCNITNLNYSVTIVNNEYFRIWVNPIPYGNYYGFFWRAEL